jgi:hypothetical protein
VDQVTRLGALLVLAKEPVPGRVKTRLTPACTAEEAATLALAALVDTLYEARIVRARRHVLVLDGSPGDWLPAGWQVVAQTGGGLDRRLAAAFDPVTGPALLVGMDTPQVRAHQIEAFDPDRHDAALGATEDGGYWAIGFRRPSQAAMAIPGVPMSQADTGAVQLSRLRSAGLSVQCLDTLVDVDTVESAAVVAAVAPHTRFAASWAAIPAAWRFKPGVLADEIVSGQSRRGG